MAMVITSYTPETGPVTGGTECTVTGTGLDDCDVVLVGNNEATIVGTPTATTVVFRTPAAASASNADVVLVDTSTPADVKATDPFVYTAVSTAEPLKTTLASKFRLDVSANIDTDWSDMGDTDRKVRGITTIKNGMDYTTEDDSDIDTGIWGATLVTGLTASITGTVKRAKGVSSGVYDPGQEIIRHASDHPDTAEGLIKCRIYDRTGGPEAYEFFSLCQWSPQGGNKTGDKVDFTLNAQGERTTITNPVLADSSLT